MSPTPKRKRECCVTQVMQLISGKDWGDLKEQFRKIAIAAILTFCFCSPQCVNLPSLSYMEGSFSPEEACRLIGEELGIEISRVRSCFDENGSRVCCLVRNLIEYA